MADPGKPSRRDLFKGAALAGVAVSGAASAQTPPAPIRREALETLSATEADILEAFCARLIPSDETGPGAREARAAHYIDRSLAGALAASRETYRAGLLALDARAMRTKLIPFHRLNEADQDAVLAALEKEDPIFF